MDLSAPTTPSKVLTPPRPALVYGVWVQRQDTCWPSILPIAGPLEFGQADGVACRTLEMLEAFGVSEHLMTEAYWVNELTFWRPDPTAARVLRLASRGLWTSTENCRPAALAVNPSLAG